MYTKKKSIHQRMNTKQTWESISNVMYDDLRFFICRISISLNEKGRRKVGKNNKWKGMTYTLRIELLIALFVSFLLYFSSKN